MKPQKEITCQLEKTKEIKATKNNGDVRVYFPRDWKAKNMVDYIRELYLNQLPEEARNAQIEIWKQLDAQNTKTDQRKRTQKG